jgi:hypothetical protein
MKSNNRLNSCNHETIPTPAQDPDQSVAALSRGRHQGLSHCADWKQIDVRLRLGLTNRNYVGCILAAACTP